MFLLKFSALCLLLSSQVSAVVASPGSGDVGTSASSSTLSTNTPCNGYPSFCNRKYSNVTMVAAHNSPFIAPGNVASNQYLNVTTQLNDGIRMITSESYLINNTIYLCHTNCALLNAGTLEAYLTTVVSWLSDHPNEVITILLVNSEYIDPGNYTAPIQNSGLINYVYTPPKVPMGLDDWPTLGEMILSGKRTVVMLDYQANQAAIPWLIDEFGQMWETPFSPTNASFPCTPQRPPVNTPGALPRTNHMYMANHNLDIEFVIGTTDILVPAIANLSDTNSNLIQYSTLGATRTNCTAMWGRPPNFLLVDYYNVGNFNGSVFQVAADANGVPYNRASCCDTAGKVSPDAQTTAAAATAAATASSNAQTAAGTGAGTGPASASAQATTTGKASSSVAPSTPAATPFFTLSLVVTLLVAMVLI